MVRKIIMAGAFVALFFAGVMCSDFLETPVRAECLGSKGPPEITYSRLEYDDETKEYALSMNITLHNFYFSKLTLNQYVMGGFPNVFRFECLTEPAY